MLVVKNWVVTIHTNASIMHSAGGILLCLFNNTFFTDSITILLLKLGNIFTTLKLTIKEFSCKFPFQLRSSIVFNICCVSCILVSTLWTSWETFFKKNLQVFDCCSTTSHNDSSRIILFANFYHSIHLPGFYILWVLNSFTTYPFFNPCINFIFKCFCMITI